MKKRERFWFWLLMFLPLAVDLMALPFLPDQIPAHYGADDQVTRWGSKWETLIFPLCTLGFGAMMRGIANASGKGEKGENNARVCMLGAIAGLAVFNLMTFYFLYADFQQAENLSQVPVDLYQLLMGGTGVAMVFLGNRMPKLGRNSLVGLRTRWSLQDDDTWKKCQRFGGFSFMLGGVAMVVICLQTKGLGCLFGCLVLFAILLTVDVAYTRWAATSSQ